MLEWMFMILLLTAPGGKPDSAALFMFNTQAECEAFRKITVTDPPEGPHVISECKFKTREMGA
jgi:hypothetical protein